MDLNELLHAHQIEVMRASASSDDEGRRGHFDKVALYAEQIRSLRDFRRSAHPAPMAAPGETIVYRTYAGNDAPYLQPAVVDAWEEEGGSLDRPVPLPDGIILTIVPQYAVGTYRYTDLALARAEYLRQARSSGATRN